jgi:hypothetical protein
MNAKATSANAIPVLAASYMPRRRWCAAPFQNLALLMSSHSWCSHRWKPV